MTVSIPEKTLEHWCSQYLTYRYNSLASLWWPTSGQDIDVRWLPLSPGKAVQLEIKTTTVTGHNSHEVRVDLGQLWDYTQLPPASQPFYVFPRPDWDGELEPVASANGYAVTELGFKRSGDGWWFGDWMFALTTAQVADTLRHELNQHGRSERKHRRRLARFRSAGTVAEWGHDGKAAAPELITWPNLWDGLNTCGRTDWPQLFRVPAELLGPLADELGSLDHSRLPGLLLEAMALQSSGERMSGSFVTLASSRSGRYTVMANHFGIPSVPSDDASGVQDDHRMVVFLDARKLTLT